MSQCAEVACEFAWIRLGSRRTRGVVEGERDLTIRISGAGECARERATTYILLQSDKRVCHGLAILVGHCVVKHQVITGDDKLHETCCSGGLIPPIGLVFHASFVIRRQADIDN